MVPDSAHGTNPASATMCGYDVVTVPSGDDGLVDVDALEGLVDEQTAGLMLTNPNTLGVFEVEIERIAKVVQSAGALLYYDGANFNAICRSGADQGTWASTWSISTCTRPSPHRTGEEDQAPGRWP